MESVVYKQPVWYKVHLTHERRQETKHPKDKPKKGKKYRRKDGVVGTDLALLKGCFSLKSCSPKFRLCIFLLKVCKWDVCEKEPPASAVGRLC